MTALMTERRSQLYLGGLLASGLGILSLMGLANAFIGSSGMYDVEVYLGLLVFAGFVVFDTQVMVERAEQGRRDVPVDALMLFTDLFGVFVRLLIILSRNRENDRRRRRRSSSSSDK